MNDRRRWLALGLPILASVTFTAWAADRFATSANGYIAAYVHPLIPLGAVTLIVVGAATSILRRTRRLGIGVVLAGVVMIPSYIAAVTFLDRTGRISWRNERMVRIGPDVRSSLVVYLKSGMTEEQINDFLDRVLSNPDPRGKGHRPLPGIASIGRVPDVDGHAAIAVDLRGTATAKETGTIRDRLAHSEYVYRVLEDVVSQQVEHLK